MCGYNENIGNVSTKLQSLKGRLVWPWSDWSLTKVKRRTERLVQNTANGRNVKLLIFIKKNGVMRTVVRDLKKKNFPI